MAQRKPIVSVVLPIYNVEPYLEQCLDSVAGQTLADIEIICVNDGSTDASPSIVARYAAADERFIVVDKPNGGYGQAVNWGIERAAGEWIAIVEPDDFIDEHMYEDLVGNAYLDDGSVPDIVKSSYWLFYDAKGDDAPRIGIPALSAHMPGRRCEFNVYDDAQVLRHHPSIWSAIYRREFIEQHGIRMREIPGGGWADNPWLYETMLQAKSVVWIPGMYYYYRQTNPNSSIALKDCQMVFDRLRDIRAIYGEFGIENEGLLLALYHRTLNYVHGTVLGSYGVRESDPEFKELAREAFEFMDPRLVSRKDNGIGAIKREYYLDFMGLKAEGVAVRAAEQSPLFSIVLSLENDRKGLWDTIDSVLRQKEGRWEFIVVDCDSSDRGPEIVRDVASRDQRFSLLGETAANIGEAFVRGARKARGDYIAFVRSGVRFMGTQCLSRIACACPDFEGVDVIAVGTSFDRFAGRGVQRGKRASYIDCPGNPEIAATNLDPSIYAKLFKRESLLSALPLVEGASDDPDGHALNVAAFIHAERVALVDGCEIRDATRVRMMMGGLRGEQDLIDLEHGRYDEMAAVARRDGSDTAWRVARGCIVHAMRIALERRGAKRSGAALYEMLRHAFAEEYGIADASKSSFANYDDYRVLEAAFFVPYEQFVPYDDGLRYKAHVDLVNKRDSYRRTRDQYRVSNEALRRDLKEAKGTMGYKVSAYTTKLLGGGKGKGKN